MHLIDGSRGEGGGQILRSSLALSLITQTPIQLIAIRAGRARPGLMKQHLAAVRAAAEVGDADVDGASLGSMKLFFRPKRLKSGEYHFAVGSAGSATLVLQTVLPALLSLDSLSVLTLEGGTHNPAAPPFDFLSTTFAPALARVSGRIELELERPGFYPRGGGRIRARIHPSGFRPFELIERGPIVEVRAVARVAGLSRKIAERELAAIREVLTPRDLIVEELPGSYGPGNVAFVELRSRTLTEVVTGFGERGVPAETVGQKIAEEAKRYLDSGAPVGEHLADQLIIPLALAGEGAFVASTLTLHTQTQLELVPELLPVRFDTRPLEGGSVRIEARSSR
ncbi:MAG: RNA 3'-terminal phosphate cyclase [Deltaproteobacteria bacterium]|nr:RNA 3'-terminal phosphate cyclase [Deltaproteobacteria bacterium]